MKKGILFFVAVMLLAGVAQAGILDQAEEFIKTHPARTGIYYDFVNNKADEYVAATLAENVFIKNLDLSAAWNFKEAVVGQVDYAFKTGAVSPYVGLGFGINRINQINDLGEPIFETHAGVKF